ncbi:MAG TPA: NAD-dependent epimerase/dehydratase family protein [Chitinophagaceae bacterium]|nr:NAD-dependent epimerase/dehydratase family protein [Chitinophagaceae bacterium]
MKKVLVTGATGFVGHYVVKELLRYGYTVIASSANEQKATKTSWFDKVTYISFDLEQFNQTINYYHFFKQPDLMIHLAWEGLPNYKSSFHLEQNLPRHLNLLTNLIKNGLTDLTVTGTCLEYGMQEGSLKEDMPALPSIPYAVAKNELRKSLEALKQQHSFSFKWVRLFYMYGEGQNPNSLLSQLDKAIDDNEEVFNMSGGEQTRDYLPVEKVAEYIVRISVQNKVTEIINCSSGQPITIKQFVKNYLQKVNKEISFHFGYYPYTDYEPMHFLGNNDKLKMILNNE